MVSEPSPFLDLTLLMFKWVTMNFLGCIFLNSLQTPIVIAGSGLSPVLRCRLVRHCVSGMHNRYNEKMNH